MTDVEHKLEMAAPAIDWPEADLTARVTARIAAEERVAARPRWFRVAVAAAAIVLVVVATPAGREALAGLLEVGGIRVGWGEVAAPHSDLELGREVVMPEVGDLVPFELLIPTAESNLGPPDRVYYADFPPGGAVHFVWEAGPALPAADGTEVGLLYSQFRSGGLGGFIKTLQAGAEASVVTVRGNDGFWIEGAPHVIFYEDAQGNQERARLAANVLAWEEDGVTHRIETTGTLEFAMELADSLR